MCGVGCRARVGCTVETVGCTPRGPGCVNARGGPSVASGCVRRKHCKRGQPGQDNSTLSACGPYTWTWMDILYTFCPIWRGVKPSKRARPASVRGARTRATTALMCPTCGQAGRGHDSAAGRTVLAATSAELSRGMEDPLGCLGLWEHTNASNPPKIHRIPEVRNWGPLSQAASQCLQEFPATTQQINVPFP